MDDKDLDGRELRVDLDREIEDEDRATVLVTDSEVAQDRATVEEDPATDKLN